MVATSRLRKLCLRGILKPFEYFKFKLSGKCITRRKFRHSFSIEKVSEADCKMWFRFSKRHIKRMVAALRIPAIITTRNNSKCEGTEALCIMLRRLCYPNRLCELEKLFDRDVTAISSIANWITRFIYLKHGHLLSTLCHSWTGQEGLEKFAQVIRDAGSPYPNLVGFIDGTTRPICRPTHNQERYYSGYKKCHVLKYQSIVTPNGLIARLDGPYVGRRHDAAILTLSNLVHECSRVLNQNGRKYALYGDPGYSNQEYIKVGYKRRGTVLLTPQQKLFNRDMSALRVHVEYGFGKILQLFGFLDFRRGQMVLKQPVKQQYLVAAILTNCYICLNGSQISDYFNCAPPSLEEYINS